jgi:hypothetical protein
MAIMRTSEVDPIRVDFIDGAAAGVVMAGRIGLTIAPGKRDRERLWDRDLAADLARLRAFYRADVLASLMEDFEYGMLEIPDLQPRAEAIGIEVRRFPIVDVDAPREAELAAFTAYVDGLVAAATAGKTVVIHCRGGIGRSGTVAACCLVQLGLTSKAAIAATRAARAGAVEAPPQWEWVARFARAVR